MPKSNIRISVKGHPLNVNLQIIKLEGSIDPVTLEEMDSKIMPIVEKQDMIVLLDLSKVDYISSTGMVSLMKYQVKLKRRNGNLKIIKPPAAVYEVLSIAGVAKVMDIYDTIEDAIMRP